MFSKIWLINILLILFISFVGVKVQKIWQKQEVNSKTVLNRESTNNEINFNKNIIRKISPDLNYKQIFEKNLFSPKRIELVPQEKPKQDAEKPKIEAPKSSEALGNNIILYGVILMNNYKAALINNPVKKPNENDFKWVKIGDVTKINFASPDFTISEINKERILLAQGETKYEVLLYDKKKLGLFSNLPDNSNSSKTGDNKDLSNPNIITTGSEKQPKTNDNSTDSSKKLDKPDNKDKDKDNNDEYEIIKTPFGDIKRKKVN